MKRVLLLALTTLLVGVCFVLPTSAASLSHASASVAPFRVTSVSVTVTPATLSTWRCGASIQVVYHAAFRVSPGPSGGIISFATTTNNGRSEAPEQLTILPGQGMSDFTWTWQGALPADHVSPGLGGVLVTAPNTLISPLIQPSGACRL